VASAFSPRAYSAARLRSGGKRVFLPAAIAAAVAGRVARIARFDDLPDRATYHRPPKRCRRGIRFLNARGISAPRGGEWSAAQVHERALPATPAPPLHCGISILPMSESRQPR
jgi:hypothetical protein